MQSILFFPRVALAALALGTAVTPPLLADDATASTTATTPAPACSKHGKHQKDAVLTDAEKAQLEKAKAAALAADPSLQTEENTLKQDKVNDKGTAVAKGDKKAYREEKRDFKSKLRTAELKIDPTLSPIFAKLDAAHPGKHKKA